MRRSTGCCQVVRYTPEVYAGTKHVKVAFYDSGRQRCPIVTIGQKSARKDCIRRSDFIPCPECGDCQTEKVQSLPLELRNDVELGCELCCYSACRSGLSSPVCPDNWVVETRFGRAACEDMEV